MRRVLGDYGMALVLLGLCLLFSVLTLNEQSPNSDAAAADLIAPLASEFDTTDVILAVGAANTDSALFAEKLGVKLAETGFLKSQVVAGEPRDLRAALDDISNRGDTLAAIVVSADLEWRVLDQLSENYPEFADHKVLRPPTRLWPDFLKRDNLLAIVDRIVVIAIIAVGMTLVIITAGIDLSVGSLIALSAVVGTLVMKTMGGPEASSWVVLFGFLAGIACCALVGALCGTAIYWLKTPPFIATLAVMLIARGLAFQTTGGFSIYQVPPALAWLGQGRSFGVPNTVILLVIVYGAAHLFMSHTKLARHIYAVGGNRQAARLSGVPVGFVIVFAYVASAVAAGLGGCIQASQLNTGTPNMGMMYELYVIAAVVVGGTSLSGGSGKILGTLIGAFIISVIQNGMNLLGIGSYAQQIVLGSVILGAVILDNTQKEGGIRSLLRSTR